MPRKLAHEVHDRRLLASEVAGVEVVRERVEPGEHPGAVRELRVRQAVADPGVLVFALEHLVDGEQPGDALAGDGLLARHVGAAAPGREHLRGDVEALAADVIDERVLELHLALGVDAVVLAHEVLALAALRRRDDDGEAEVRVAAQDLLDAEHFAEVVVGRDHLGELAAEELDLESVAESGRICGQPRRHLEELVRLCYVHSTSLRPLFSAASLDALRRRRIAVPVARARSARVRRRRRRPAPCRPGRARR